MRRDIRYLPWITLLISLGVGNPLRAEDPPVSGARARRVSIILPTRGAGKLRTAAQVSAEFPARPSLKPGPPVTTLGVVHDRTRFEIGVSEELSGRAKRGIGVRGGTRRLLDELRDFTLEGNRGAVLVAEHDVHVGDVPGRECLMKSKVGMLSRMRFYYDGRRFYTSLVVGTREQVDAKSSTEFLDSLELPELREISRKE